MSYESKIKQLKEKYSNESDFQEYQQSLITQHSRAIYDEDLNHWNHIDWFVFNNLEELYV